MFGLAFVVALNVALRIDQAEAPTVFRGRQVNEWQMRPVPGPGGAVGDFEPVLTTRLILQETEAELNAYNLDRLRNWSIVSVVGLALASGAGGWILSGMMLRPVRDITEVASAISATNLNQRINYEGPDDELKALADTFDSMIARLEASFDKQRQFVQDASHELRTPLTAIRTNIEVAEMDPDMSPDEYRALLDTIKTQTERLTRLSEDLLLLTRNEDEPLETEPVDALALAREVAKEMAPLAAARRVELVVSGEDEVWVEANGDLLYRCLVNLVDNGIKYSSEPSAEWSPDSTPRSKVTVVVASASGGASVAVTDTGPGIPPESQEKVFNRFYRMDKGRSRQAGGSGLGLAIVRELMEAQGGSVTLRSEPGKGATFELHLKPLGAVVSARPEAIEV